ncbi:CHASE2 domain-containing protein [Luteolibacter algae]|uniref:CHASE2 domain-containing protein n=1 Tax=Luteolibacter algae TaxID=454151 RepID=A0ABW5DAL5_9BACT
MLIALVAFIPPASDHIISSDRKLGDSALYVPNNPSPREDLVFLGIDEESLTLQGLDPALIQSDENLTRMSKRFPWDRRVYADTATKLLNAGAKLVVIDLVMAEPSTPEADEALAEVLRKYPGKIVLATVFAPRSNDGKGDAFMLIEPAPVFTSIDPPPLLGFVNFRPNPDDLLIREIDYTSTLSQENGQAPIAGEAEFQSIAGSVLRSLGKPAPFQKAQIRYAVKAADVDPLKIDRSKAYEVYQPLSISSIFLPDAWTHRYKSGEFFRDKVVLIGPATARFQDNHQTPVGQLMGPQLHLQAIGSGLDRAFVSRPFGEWAGSIFWSGIAGALSAAILIRFLNRPIIILLSTVTIVVVSFFTAFACARHFGIWFSPRTFAIALFVGAVSGQSFDLIRERVERSRLHHQFRRFVSRDVADSLVNDPSIYKQAASGRKRKVVVLFSDIRGFTSLSEQVSPEQLFSQLNEYLSAMVKIIFAHNGTLDKFIGDAILAHWGALEDGDESQFATSALAATKAMIEELEKLNQDWESRGLPVLGIGIGLHLGEVLAGEIGSEQRTEFGVIGDAVNLASRLEGMTKAFSCPWLASGQFIQATGASQIHRRIARVRVKGRQEPVDLWTTSQCPASLESYTKALECFERGDFVNALCLCEKHLADYPDDLIARNLTTHTQRFLNDRPDQWDGIIKFNEK